jgi:hypothetical protein
MARRPVRPYDHDMRRGRPGKGLTTLCQPCHPTPLTRELVAMLEAKGITCERLVKLLKRNVPMLQASGKFWAIRGEVRACQCWSLASILPRRAAHPADVS